MNLYRVEWHAYKDSELGKDITGTEEVMAVSKMDATVAIFDKLVDSGLKPWRLPIPEFIEVVKV